MADEHDRLVQPEPEVLEGEDDVPRQPVAPHYATDMDAVGAPARETSGGRGAFGAMRLALIPLLVVVAVVLYAALR